MIPYDRSMTSEFMPFIVTKYDLFVNQIFTRHFTTSFGKPTIARWMNSI